MSLDDLAEPLVRIAAGFVGEVLVRGVGYALVKHIWYGGRRDPDPESATCALVGLAVWIAAIGAGIFIFRRARAAI